MRVVQKYGGSSVATIEQIKKIAEDIKERLQITPQIVVVVSAMGKTTNSLISLSQMITKNPDKRELDVLLSTGETQTISLLAIALQELKVPAISFMGFQAGIYTNNIHSRAFITKIDTSRIEEELSKNKVVIIAGFQGISQENDITTFGRGGSDTTAVALASALKCPCEIYTDVDSIYTINPQNFPQAKPIHKVRYDDMMEMALCGAKVLETRCVELAKKYGVCLYLGRALNKDKNKGSFIMENTDLEQMPITNLSIKEDITLIKLTFKNPTLIPQIFEVIKQGAINLEMFYSGQNQNQNNLSFICPNSEVDSIEKELKTLSKNIKITTCSEYVKLSLIGSGLSTHTDIATSLFKELEKQKISVYQIVISEISISFTINKKDLEKAVNNIANLFQLQK